MDMRISKTRKTIHNIRNVTKDPDNTYNIIYTNLIYKWKNSLTIYLQIDNFIINVFGEEYFNGSVAVAIYFLG